MHAQRVSVEHQVSAESRESLRDLLGDLVTQSSDLVKDELALLKAEMRQEVRRYPRPAIIFAVGAIFGLLAAMALLTAGIIALSTYIGLVYSSLIFGGVLALVGALLMALGLSKFKRNSSERRLLSVD
ncbi:MAG: phage holin family protein [Acidobacteriota bacterium]